MSVSPPGRLYDLLPTYYRQQDVRVGQPLRALLAILENELRALEENMLALYDDWFIETCADWVVPYLAELLGVSGLNEVQSNIPAQRTRVANAVSTLRRKGTTATLERTITEVTNWYARAVAYSWLVSRTQNVKAVHLDAGRTVNVRDALALSALGGPFEQIAHTIDVRAIAAPAHAAKSGATRGRFNILDMGIFLWRLRSYPTDYQMAMMAARNTGPTPGEYTFHPFGLDVPLFNVPEPQPNRDRGARAINLPIPLTIPVLAASLAFAPLFTSANQAEAGDYYGPDRGLYLVRDGVGIPPTAVASIALDWGAPGFTLDWEKPPLIGKAVAIDVTRGRMAFEIPPTATLAAHYAFGFSGDLGGGPYDRSDTLATGTPDWSGTVCLSGDCAYMTIEAALHDWNDHACSADTLTGVLRIMDNGVYTLPPAQEIHLPRQGGLVIEARNTADPFIVGNLTVIGQASGLGEYAERTLTLNGLFLDGQIALDRALSLAIVHSTLIPRAGRVSVVWQGATPAPADALDLKVTVQRSVVGPLRLPPQADALVLRDSIVDASGAVEAPAISWYPAPGDDPPPPYGPPTKLTGVTVLGPVVVCQCDDARNSIFTGRVLTERRQVGMIGWSYVLPDSETPRRLRCQPDLALAAARDAATRARIAARIQPRFVSTTYGQATYAQLSEICPEEIRQGSDDGSEMGAYCVLNPTKRQGNLHAVLDAYLEASEEPGIFFAT